ncbi:MAG: MarR family transcriptional regulator [Chloroflexi bacterium]|nr:MAG: MarR family transcriptional regulator [Chloroflexota bacterium]
MTNEKEMLYNLLKETFILLDDGDRKLFGTYKLTPPRFYALTHINEEPGLSSSKLSNRLLCDKSNVTRIVKGLENEELIVRKQHETDGRAQRLYLTEQGSKVLEKVQQAHQEFNAHRMNCIDSLSSGNLIQNLTTLNESLLSTLIQYDHTNPENGNIT